MEFFLETIATQGLGYLLFSGSLLIIFYLYREIKSLSAEIKEMAEKRVEDLKHAQLAYTSISQASRAIAENTYTIVQNMQQILNSLKKLS